MDISLSISIPIAILVALIIATHYYYKNAFKFWRARGLDGPKAIPFFGNFGRLMLDPEQGSKWMSRFGKIYGAYDGSEPVLVVSDPDVSRQLCIKDFNTFPNHPDLFFGSELGQGFIIGSKGDRWRHMRSVMSPTFTSGKMRRMYKLLEVCAEEMLEALRQRLETNSVVNMKDLFGLYTMDAIASCCYGLRLMSYKGEASLTTVSNQNEFVKLALKLFDFKLWRILVVACVRGGILKWFKFGAISHKVEWNFATKVKQIIKRRRETDKNFDDYLQTLIDGTIVDANDQLDAEQHHAANPDNQHSMSQSTERGLLSEIEILGNASFLLVAGLETTTTLLTHCVYALSFHQTVQEKLYQAIKHLARFDELTNKVTFEYDALTECQYLDAVISETLRRHPPAMQTDRYASEDYILTSHNLQLPKGTRVWFTLKEIMNDPDNWPEPEIFDPERFSPDRLHKIKPYSYCPFGIGPRHCLGMRFSLTESKIALAKLLLEFKFEPAPGTRYPPENLFALGLNNIKRPEVIVINR